MIDSKYVTLLSLAVFEIIILTSQKFRNIRYRGRIFTCVRPIYERAVSDLGTRGSHTTKNTASVVTSSGRNCQ